jgi:hypothetical protein
MNDDGTIHSALPPLTGWRELAARASEERDPEKLLQLVKQLGDELEQEEQQKKRLPRGPNLSHPDAPNSGRLGDEK